MMFLLQHAQFAIHGVLIPHALHLVEVALKPELAWTAQMFQHKREVATLRIVVRFHLG